MKQDGKIIRYSVFVSSTKKDLSEQRMNLIYSLWKADYIAIAMENFSSNNSKSVSIIEKSLNITDYYVLIVANTYGSLVRGKGISYTQYEYNLAKELGIPILTFIYTGNEIAHLNEEDDEKKTKLEKFKEILTEDHTVTYFSSFNELNENVITALHKTINDDPRGGWTRNVYAPTKKKKIYRIL